MSIFWDRQMFYSDGITKVTDPFWCIVCAECGHKFLSCTCFAKCPNCGCKEGRRSLGEKTYEEVIAERGNPVISE